MSDAFQDRENTFEKQFAHDEDLRFKAVARRNKALALWVAEMKKLPQADAEKYAHAFVAAQVGKSDDDVAAALKRTSTAATSTSPITVCARRWTRKWPKRPPRSEPGNNEARHCERSEAIQGPSGGLLHLWIASSFHSSQ